MLGYTRAELLELHIPDIDAALTRDEQAAAIKKIAANGSGVFETKHRRKDGSTFAVELSVTFQNGSGAKLLVPECS